MEANAEELHHCCDTNGTGDIASSYLQLLLFSTLLVSLPFLPPGPRISRTQISHRHYNAVSFTHLSPERHPRQLVRTPI